MVTKQTVLRFRLEASVKQALASQAALEDLTTSQLMRRLIREYLKKHNQGDLL